MAGWVFSGILHIGVEAVYRKYTKLSWFYNSEEKENVRNDVCHVFIFA